MVIILSRLLLCSLAILTLTALQTRAQDTYYYNLNNCWAMGMEPDALCQIGVQGNENGGWINSNSPTCYNPLDIIIVSMIGFDPQSSLRVGINQCQASSINFVGLQDNNQADLEVYMQWSSPSIKYTASGNVAFTTNAGAMYMGLLELTNGASFYSTQTSSIQSLNLTNKSVFSVNAPTTVTTLAVYDSTSSIYASLGSVLTVSEYASVSGPVTPSAISFAKGATLNGMVDNGMSYIQNSMYTLGASSVVNMDSPVVISPDIVHATIKPLATFSFVSPSTITNFGDKLNLVVQDPNSAGLVNISMTSGAVNSLTLNMGPDSVCQLQGQFSIGTFGGSNTGYVVVTGKSTITLQLKDTLCDTLVDAGSKLTVIGQAGLKPTLVSGLAVADSSTLVIQRATVTTDFVNVTSASKLVLDSSSMVVIPQGDDLKGTFQVWPDSSVEFRDPPAFPIVVPMLVTELTDMMFQGSVVISFSQSHPAHVAYSVLSFVQSGQNTIILPSQTSVSQLSFPTKSSFHYSVSNLDGKTTSLVVEISGLTIGAFIGVIVGSVLGVVVIAALIGGVIIYRRRRQAQGYSKVNINDDNE
ncbi:hypothetical protein SAMD00019534_040790 [Acytostelium subglobosum LB1]|uniref:hypothetical protein n=1 Tax=Acytostelium subglobosum LB1 TaxID=1410327 RepID=UPI000644FBAA|nr:hypothetical protein SAMD00019534_040790 [Acytostelium subglobosum LB1]GAM20904.1 hypothetical protein SAMD00019534_040790 [Acytostelium subglobosum LB1]|eukprot:XP_012756038.1 hypothetical protein SAMD00019534_040790 [Acytostelium subglobosum LB1]